MWAMQREKGYRASGRFSLAAMMSQKGFINCSLVVHGILGLLETLERNPQSSGTLNICNGSYHKMAAMVRWTMANHKMVSKGFGIITDQLQILGVSTPSMFLCWM